MKNQAWTRIVKIMKKITIAVILAIVKLLLPIILAVVIISAFWRTITIIAGKNDTSDLRNVGGTVTKNNKKATILLEDGSLEISQSAKELWENLAKEKSTVVNYLSGPEDLAKLMKAELVTQYPDTRKNPDEPIDWEELFDEDSKKSYGIVKLNRTLIDEKEIISSDELTKLEDEYEKYINDVKRKNEEAKIKQEKKEQEKQEDENKENAKKEEIKQPEKEMTFDEWMENRGCSKNKGKWEKPKKIRMSYVDPETFNKNIEKYRKTGLEKDRKEAMKYFTLEKSNVESIYSVVDTISSLDKVLFVGDSLTVGLQQKEESKLPNSIFRAEVGMTAKYWLDHFDELPSNEEVNAVCVLLGVNNPSTIGSMKTLINKLVEKYPEKNIYIQRVFPVAKEYNDSTGLNQKIAEYNSNIKNYCEQKEKVYFVDTTNGYIDNEGYLKPEKTSDGLHFSDYSEWLSNINNMIISQDASAEIIEDINKQEENNNVKEDEKSDDKKTENNTINIENNVPNLSNSDVYLYNNPYYKSKKTLIGQCTWFAWGAFYEIYGFDPGFRGNGGICVDQLLQKHPDKFVQGSIPVVGSVFSEKREKGACGHVGIVVDTDGDSYTIIEGNSSKIWNYPSNIPRISGATTRGWKKRTVTNAYFKRNNTVFANPVDAVNPQGLGQYTQLAPVPYCIKVANWSTTSSELEGDNFGDKINKEPTIYEMRETKIDYYNLVRGYTLPFDYLWDLILMSQDKDFVMELADLVYNSEIEITLNDNITTTTTINEYEFDKVVNTKTIDTIIKNIIDENELDGIRQEEEKIENEEEIKEPHNIKLKTISTTNTVEAGVTKANTWIIEYTKDYKMNGSDTGIIFGEQNERKDLDDDPSKIEDKVTKYDFEDPQTFKTIYREIREKIYTIGWKEKIGNGTRILNYNETTPYVREKTSKELKNKDELKNDSNFIYKEKNFVTLLMTHERAFKNLYTSKEILNTILEENESTKEIMPDLTKYLLYKAQDKNIENNVDFDFNIFEPGKFSSANSSFQVSGNDAEEMVWNALTSAGFSPIATAGAMGNFKVESGFDFGIVEKTTSKSKGYGLAQWTNGKDGNGRRKNLEDFAKSRGVPPSDPALQLEFLIGELTPGGGADGFAKYQIKGPSKDWYDGTNYTAEMWKNASNPETAAIAFMALFERPQVNPEGMMKRKGYAREYYNKFVNKTNTSD